MPQSLRASSTLRRSARSVNSWKTHGQRKPFHFEQLEERRLLAVDLEAWPIATSADGLSDTVLTIATGDDSSIYVAGQTWGSFPGYINAGITDAYLRKYDQFGNEQWTVQFGSPLADSINSVAVDSTGIYVAGNAFATLPGFNQLPGAGSAPAQGDGFVAKFSLNGDATPFWAHEGYADQLSDIAIDGSGVYIGGANLTNVPEAAQIRSDGYVAKLDVATGTVVWNDEFGDSSLFEDLAFGGFGVVNTGARSLTAHNGVLYAAAVTEGDIEGVNAWRAEGIIPTTDVVVRKYDASTGTVIWTDQFGGKGRDGEFGLDIDAGTSGAYVLLDGYGLDPALPEDPFRNTLLRKYELEDVNGSYDLAWTAQSAIVAHEIAGGLAVSDEGVYVTGSVSPPDLSRTDVFVRKYETGGGGTLWTKSLTAADVAGGMEHIASADVAVENGYVFVAINPRNGNPFPPPQPPALDPFLVRIDYDSDADCIVHSVDTVPSTFSNDFSDLANGGTTTGAITSRGDQILTIADVPFPDGVLVHADPSGGAAPATIAVDNATYEIDAGDSLTITRGSVTTQILKGAVTATFFDGTGEVVATSILDAGTKLTFEPETVTFLVGDDSRAIASIVFVGADGQQATADLSAGNEISFNPVSFTFTAPADNTEPVQVVVNNSVVEVAPGSSVQPVQIDIRPGSGVSSVNLDSNGVIAVAILSSATFDARDVIASSVVFAGANAAQSTWEDVNGDGQADLLLHFRTQDTDLRALYELLLAEDLDGDGVLDGSHQTASVSLSGETVDQVLIEGFDDLDLFLAGRSLRSLLEDLAEAGAI
jgi:hypothetical protein